MKELSEEKALYKAAALCSAAEHCVVDIRMKLDKWNIPIDAQERILKRLLQEKYIDEDRFCRFFINDKIRFNKWGRQKISQSLYFKKIPKEIIQNSLDKVDVKEYVEILVGLLKSKKKTLSARNDYELNQKLLRFGVGRGFEIDLIRKYLPENVE
jgi:regulatory protein